MNDRKRVAANTPTTTWWSWKRYTGREDHFVPVEVIRQTPHKLVLKVWGERSPDTFPEYYEYSVFRERRYGESFFPTRAEAVAHRRAYLQQKVDGYFSNFTRVCDDLVAFDEQYGKEDQDEK